MSPIAEILQEIKNKCDIDTYTYLNSFITVKLNGYRLEREETRMVKYEKSINEQWFKMFFIAKKLQGLSDRSLKVYRTEITRFITAVKKNLSEITTDDIRYYLACMQIKGNCSKVTLDNTRRYLNTFFQWLEDEEYIVRSPMKKIKKIKQKKEEKEPLSNDEINLLRFSCEGIKKDIEKKRLIAIIEVLISTGCRAEELCNIKICDIDFNTNDITITGKGDKERVVYLNSSAKLRLKEYLESRSDNVEYAFVSLISPYKQLKTNGLGKALRDLGKKCDIEKVHPHRFRRTCACMLIDRGMPIQEVSKYLGHEDLRTTQIYVRVEQERIKQSHKKFMS